MKFLGREPALWTAATTAVLAVIGSLGLDIVTPGAAFAAAGVVNAVIIAATTRPIGPPLFTGVFQAGVALLTEYGLNMSDAQVTTWNTAIVAVVLLLRAQISPTSDAHKTGVLGDRVTTESTPPVRLRS